jgi:putative intracellular protease/amidase
MPTIATLARIAIISVCLMSLAHAQGTAKSVVAVIGHNGGTEPTDFLVPFAVIAGSGLADVHAVALTSGPVLLHPSNVRLEVPHTIASFDAAYPDGADYVIVPAVHHAQDAAMTDWLRKQRASGATLMSICDGAKVLAHAGILKGKSATAHWYALDDLRKEFPETVWRNDRRYIFDGDVITTSGVSASVPATLALLETIAGREPTQRYATQLGITSWPAAHDSSGFEISGAMKRLVVANKLAFWRHERVELELPQNVDEASAALVMDAYSRTYRTGVALSAPKIRTRHGLILRSTGEKADRKVDPALFQLPLGKTLDTILKQLESDYGATTADFVATQLEYVRPGVIASQ